MRVPTPQDAIQAIRQALGAGVRSITRFPTGLCHYVYDVETDDGRRVVVRMARPEAGDILAGGVYWHERLRAAGVPLPALLRADLDPPGGYPMMLLERLPGRDLDAAYDAMTSGQRQALAEEIAAIQRRVAATLPPARGFGFARSYDDPALRDSWLDVVLADLERSQSRIVSAGIADTDHVDRVRARVDAIAPYLLAVAPRAFLDDTTTKNVLVDGGTLSGIVDTDYVCFGDPLFTLALTRMALLARGRSTDYTNHWQACLRLTGYQEYALRVYTAVFCVNFLGELGQLFNHDEAAGVDTTYQSHLEATLDALLVRIDCHSDLSRDGPPHRIGPLHTLQGRIDQQAERRGEIACAEGEQRRPRADPRRAEAGQ